MRHLIKKILNYRFPSWSKIIIFLLLGEMAFRMVPPEDLVVFPPGRYIHSEFMKRLKLEPNSEFNHTSEEFNVTYCINSLGLRGPEWEDSNDVTLVLGDSYTFGLGVSFEETYVSYASSLLKEKHESNKNIFNAGTPAYSTYATKFLLEYLLSKRPFKRVIVGFHNLNDFVNDYDFKHWPEGIVRYKFLISSIITYFPSYLQYPTIEVISFLQSKSYLAYFFIWRLNDALVSQFSDYVKISGIDFCGPLSKRLLQTIKETQQHILNIKEICERNSVEFAILLLPQKIQVEDEFYWENPEFNRKQMNRLFNLFGQRHDIVILDPLEVMLHHKEEGEVLYFLDNGHLNANGHKVIGEFLAKYLKNK